MEMREGGGIGDGDGDGDGEGERINERTNEQTSFRGLTYIFSRIGTS